jgi:hypothetical protein
MRILTVNKCCAKTVTVSSSDYRASVVDRRLAENGIITR